MPEREDPRPGGGFGGPIILFRQGTQAEGTTNPRLLDGSICSMGRLGNNGCIWLMGRLRSQNTVNGLDRANQGKTYLPHDAERNRYRAPLQCVVGRPSKRLRAFRGDKNPVSLFSPVCVSTSFFFLIFSYIIIYLFIFVNIFTLLNFKKCSCCGKNISSLLFK